MTGGCHGYIAPDAEVSTVPIRDRGLSARKILGLARFENSLCWPPSLDGLASFARMPLVGKQLASRSSDLDGREPCRPARCQIAQSESLMR